MALPDTEAMMESGFDDNSGLSIASQDDKGRDGRSEELAIAEKETKVVSVFRIVLMAMLVVVAIAVSLTAFFITRQSEQDDFEKTFASHASKVS